MSAAEQTKERDVAGQAATDRGDGSIRTIRIIRVQPRVARIVENDSVSAELSFVHIAMATDCDAIQPVPDATRGRPDEMIAIQVRILRCSHETKAPPGAINTGRGDLSAVAESIPIVFNAMIGVFNALIGVIARISTLAEQALPCIASMCGTFGSMYVVFATTSALSECVLPCIRVDDRVYR